MEVINDNLLLQSNNKRNGIAITASNNDGSYIPYTFIYAHQHMDTYKYKKEQLMRLVC